MLGSDRTNWVSDAIGQEDMTFDEALAKDGFVVEPCPEIDAGRTMAAALREATEAKSDPIFDDAAAVIDGLVRKLETPRGTP